MPGFFLYIDGHFINLAGFSGVADLFDLADFVGAGEIDGGVVPAGFAAAVDLAGFARTVDFPGFVGAVDVADYFVVD